ncbi:competence protein ComF [Actinomyces minihominis]|uniref:competence protein ComF n=1 Tax=Actinomyces minihominis TaxID=2002838 RepID=UPI000C08327D|nr:competence protein ComF [Actinomyces minihominis]
MSTIGLMLSSIKNILFPVQCPGCGLWDVEICPQCWEIARAVPVSRFHEDAEGLPETELLCLGSYEGALRSLILTAKHDVNRDLGDFLYAAGETLGTAVGERLKNALAAHPRNAIWVVPAPSSHARRRRRAEIVPLIASGVANGLERSIGSPVDSVPAVELRRGISGQSGRSAGARSSGRSGAMRLVYQPPHGAMMVVVDDVVTTGATMRAVMGALGPGVVLTSALAAA